MSLHNLAKHVQRKGRGQDKMLVHMTPEEVHGLQRLALAHGGSLTINPETGLPEAGFLMKILPIVAAAAATYFTAGAAAPALSAALAGETALAAGTVTAGGGALAGGLAGAGVGGISAGLQGGDVGKGALFGGLGGAIAGGMGAYGGAPDASAAANPLAESNKVAQITADANQGAQLSDLVKSGGSVPADQVGNLPYSGQGPTNTLPEGYKINEFGDAYKAPPQQPNFFERLVNNPSVPTPPTSEDSKAKLEAAKLAKDFAGKGMFEKGLIYSAPGIGAALGDKPNTLPGATPYTSSATLSPDFKGYTPDTPDPYYKPQYTRYAADGGLMALAPGGMAEEKKKKQRASLTADRTMAAMGADQAGLAMLNNARYGANMTGSSPLQAGITSLGDLPTPAGASGGLADLGGYSDGGRLLKGPGDGMSDNIPAQIGRKQPARLADGEFVVPADVVSHLGNGSTDAGARRLYAMMDRARQARTGKKKQAPEVNTRRMMPA